MPARDRRAFRTETHVTVRCLRCGVRLAELRPIMTAAGPGWDGMQWADRLDSPRWPHDPIGFRCQRCKAPHAIGEVELHDLLIDAERNGHRDVTLAAQ